MTFRFLVPLVKRHPIPSNHRGWFFPNIAHPTEENLSASLFSKPLSGSILSGGGCFEYPTLRPVLGEVTFRHPGWSVSQEQVTLRYPSTGLHLEERHASIACPPRNPPVCFPSGPFCFSSISDFTTLSSTYVRPASSPLCHVFPVCSVVVRLSASTNTWQLLTTISTKWLASLLALVFVTLLANPLCNDHTALSPSAPSQRIFSRFFFLSCSTRDQRTV